MAWLPFHQDQDTDLLEDLRRRQLIGPSLSDRSIVLPVTSPEEALHHFGDASLVVAMRLHGLILAALAGSPCAALSYDPKVAAVAAALACPCLELEHLVARSDAGLAQRLASDWGARLDQAPDPAPVARLRSGTAVHAALLKRLQDPAA